MWLSNTSELFGQEYVGERLKTSHRFLWSIRGSYQTIWSPLLPNVARHSRSWPYTVKISIDQTLQLLVTVLSETGPLYRFWHFNWLSWGFHRTFTTGMTCQERPRTPQDTWSCLIFVNLHVFLFVTSLSWTCHVSGLWISSIPLYFYFAFDLQISYSNYVSCNDNRYQWVDVTMCFFFIL